MISFPIRSNEFTLDIDLGFEVSAKNLQTIDELSLKLIESVMHLLHLNDCVGLVCCDLTNSY